MRPTSNLRQQVQFKLEKREARSGFAGIFDPKLGSRNVLNDVYYCLVAGAIAPITRSIKPDSDVVKRVMSPKEDNPSVLRDKDRKRVVRSSLRKNSALKRLEFRTPLAAVSAAYMTSQIDMDTAFRGPLDRQSPEYISSNKWETSPLAGGKRVTGKEVAETFKNIPPKAREMFGTCLESIEAVKEGGEVWLWATFLITQKEAEYLCNCKWVELRMSDIYPTLIDWTASIFGRYTRLPKTISKVSMIASEVKDTLAKANGAVRPRVGVDSIVADIDGNFYVIPEVDQSASYEQQLMDFGLKEDGSYSWSQIRGLGGISGESEEGGEDADIDENDGEQKEATGNGTSYVVDVNETSPGTKKKLPANMPIFSDWLNDKFVYSNTAGNLAVYDLSDTVPATAFHFRQFFETRIMGTEQRGEGDAAFLSQMVSVAAGFDPSIYKEAPKPEDARTKSADLFVEAFNKPNVTIFNVTSLGSAIEKAFRITSHYLTDEDNDHPYEAISGQSRLRVKFVTFEDLNPNGKFDGFKFVGRMVKRAAELIEENIEVLYTKMSVMSALHLLAFAKMMKNHIQYAPQIREQDLKERSKYINQGVDPNWKTPPIANIKDLQIDKKTGEVKTDPKSGMPLGLVFQPHQAKVDNLTREHPECAAYPVDAGGGKTIMIMTNILRELEAGVCKRAIVACPSTLVNQYVEEAVFVTEGRINVIPITNQTVRMHGLERLQKMIETAPPNTLVVTDFDFVKGKARNVAYGNKSTIVWNNAEWLRQFEFDLIAVDECHKLKNLSSARRMAMSRLMQDIKYKRLASGTLVDDTMMDLVSQVALFDPTIFGSREKFNATYGENEKGGKVLAWRKGAQAEIQAKIAEHCVWAQARRREWAALLPDLQEEFHAVDMSENQRLLYDSILKETTDLIEEAMAKNPDMKEALESGDESLTDDLETMLRPYLQRLERFLSAPDEDELASVFLQNEDDKISPKVKKVHELCLNHLKNKIPGKIVIFTNYIASATAVFKYAPPALKQVMIHYTAGRKMECRSQFSGNDKYQVMVGQSSSMDTGINFQVASRLIRMETIWTPGLLEQGNSRVNRPQLKKAETRKNVFLDWLMVNRSIDVTKIARLTAKIISKSKFDNAGPDGDPAYAEVPDMQVIPMKISTIALKNDFQQELLPYLKAYNKLANVRMDDYARYRAEIGDKLKPVPVAPSGLLKGSKLMARVPYVPGMTLYGTDQLGLVRYDAFCNVDLDELETEGEDSEEASPGDNDEGNIATDDPKKLEKERHLKMLQLRWAKELELAMNMPCHTEFGDGVIYGAKRRVWVELSTGEKMRIPKLQVFVITRSTTSNKDIRQALLKQVGDIPIDAPVDVPVEVGGETNKRRRKLTEMEAKKGKKGGRIVTEEEEAPAEEKPYANFQFTVINDMMAILFDAETSSPEVSAAVQNYGFKLSPEYWYTRVRGPVILLRLFNTLAQKGFTIDKQTSSHLKKIWEYLQKYGRDRIGVAGFASSLDITHFHREVIKPVSDPKMLKIYPMVQDGLLYMIAPKKGQLGNQRAVKIVVPEIRWQSGGGGDEFLRFCNNKNEAQEVLKRIKNDGIEIANLKQLGEQWKKIKIGTKKSK